MPRSKPWPRSWPVAIERTARRRCVEDASGRCARRVPAHIDALMVGVGSAGMHEAAVPGRCHVRFQLRTTPTTDSCSPRRRKGDITHRSAEDHGIHRETARPSHTSSVAPIGAKRPARRRDPTRRGGAMLATADTDLRSLSYGHLVGDFTGPAQRGNRATRRRSLSPLERFRSSRALRRPRSRLGSRL